MLIQIVKNQLMTKNVFFANNFIVTIKTVNRGLSVSSLEGGLTNFVQELNVGKHSPANFAENIFYKLIFILFYIKTECLFLDWRKNVILLF